MIKKTGQSFIGRIHACKRCLGRQSTDSGEDAVGQRMRGSYRRPAVIPRPPCPHFEKLAHPPFHLRRELLNL